MEGATSQADLDAFLADRSWMLSSMSRAIPTLVSERLTDGEAGVTSVCTAHPLVIEAALVSWSAHGSTRFDRSDL